MTTMLNSDTDNKSIQSFRIPLEIVREDPRHDQHHQSSAPTYGGDLLISATYKRNIITVIYLSNQFLKHEFHFRETNDKL
jgi:hypothetical protein